MNQSRTPVAERVRPPRFVRYVVVGVLNTGFSYGV